MSSTGSVDVEVKRGCPQGSVIGPYVCNLMMDVLLQQLEAKCKFSAYADDLLLLVEGNTRRQLEEKSAELMQTAADWGRRIGVEVSVDKTVMMLMKGSLLHTRTPSVRYGAHAVKYVTEVKYLGMTQFVSVLTSTIICSH